VLAIVRSSGSGEVKVLPTEMVLPKGTLLDEARLALLELELDETPEQLALWMRGWCLGYTEGMNDG
jgi:hypothetical protein